MQGVWTLVYYTWKKKLTTFYGPQLGRISLNISLSLSLKKGWMPTELFILWTIADCEAWWFDIFDSSMLTDGCFSSCCGKGTKKISLSAIRCSTTEPQRLYNSQGARPSKNWFRSTHPTEKVWQLILMDQYLLFKIRCYVVPNCGTPDEMNGALYHEMALSMETRLKQKLTSNFIFFL